MSTQTVLREASINASAGHMIGEYDMPIEDSIFDKERTAAALYRFGVREYGRCTGKVYVDTDDGTRHVGYVFEKRMPYQDKPSETYLHETWLSFAEVTPTSSRYVAL